MVKTLIVGVWFKKKYVYYLKFIFISLSKGKQLSRPAAAAPLPLVEMDLIEEWAAWMTGNFLFFKGFLKKNTIWNVKPTLFGFFFLGNNVSL